MLATLTRWWSRFERWIEFVLFVKGFLLFLFKIAGALGFAFSASGGSLPASPLPVEDPNCLESPVDGVLGLCAPGDVVAPVRVSPTDPVLPESSVVADLPPQPGPGGLEQDVAEDLWQVPIVISSYFYWPYDWDGTLVDGKEPPRLLGDLRDHLSSTGIQAQIRSMTDVVAIGVASCEGEVGKEVERAGNRARFLARLVDEVQSRQDGEALRIWGLNLGHWRGRCPEDEGVTREQRPVLLVGLRRGENQAEGADLDVEKLLESLENLRALPVRPSDYEGRPDRPLVAYK